MATTLDVVLLFDTEDVFSPPEVGNDDSILELATILTEEGLRGTFLFIGDRALQLRARGRHDVIAAVSAHEVGLHTRSARHPCGPEYVQNRSWEDGLAETLRREADGVAIIREVFGQPARALSAHYDYATPHAQCAAGALGLPYIYAYAAAPPRYSLSWYAGALGLPWSSPTLDPATPFLGYFDGFDSLYPDDAAFEAQWRRLGAHIDACLNGDQPLLSLLLYHPQRVRLAEFIDRYWTANGVNLPPEQWGRYGQPARYTAAQVATALANFRRLARRLRADPRLRPVTVGEVARAYGTQPEEISRADLLAASQAIADADEILLHERYSPAEILVALAHAVVRYAADGRVPPAVPRANVLGPTANLIWYPEVGAYAWDALLQRAGQLLNHVEVTGYLPAMLGKPGERVGANHLYGALAHVYLALNAGGAPTSVPLRPRGRYPRLAEAIGLRYLRAAEGDLLDPELNVDALYRYGKLQTWTLKAAHHSS